MTSRTALVLETNPVITERYIDYTHDSDWRIMLKDTLNGFLEKLQHEKFNLIVAEESLLPQGIIQMMTATGIPFLLSSNNKNPEIPTLPRNFNRTELLTVFNRLVPKIEEAEPAEETGKGEDAVNELLSDLEDEEDAFELTPDAVISEPGRPQEKPAENDLEASSAEFFGEDDFFSDTDEMSGGTDALFSDPGKSTAKQADPFSDTGETSEELNDLFGEEKKGSERQADAPSDLNFVRKDNTANRQGNPATPPSFNGLPGESGDIDSFVDSLSLGSGTESSNYEYDPGEQTLETVIAVPENETAEAEEPRPADGTCGSDAIKAEVSAWLEKNARSIIKEIVLEQLASLSGKKND